VERFYSSGLTGGRYFFLAVRASGKCLPRFLD
jgi:hypothetical protein